MVRCRAIPRCEVNKAQLYLCRCPVPFFESGEIRALPRSSPYIFIFNKNKTNLFRARPLKTPSHAAVDPQIDNILKPRHNLRLIHILSKHEVADGCHSGVTLLARTFFSLFSPLLLCNPPGIWLDFNSQPSADFNILISLCLRIDCRRIGSQRC